MGEAHPACVATARADGIVSRINSTNRSLILAKFLLGLLAGRHRLLQDVEAHRPWFRRMLVWGLVLGVLGNGSGAGGGSGCWASSRPWAAWPSRTTSCSPPSASASTTGGLGFVGKMPVSRCIALCLVIFAVQVVLSHVWLARFRFGPAEWLWRSLTYGRAQPMRLGAKAGTAGAPASCGGTS